MPALRGRHADFDLAPLARLGRHTLVFRLLDWLCLVCAALRHQASVPFANHQRTVGLAAETFNDGLRAYYLSFAIMACFFFTIAFALATAVVVLILYNREFRSEVLEVLRG